MKYCTLLVSSLLVLTASAQKNHYLLAGTYTAGKSIGIYVYAFNTADGSARVVDSISSSNPSYLAVSPDRKFVYSVNENNAQTGGGKLSAFSIDRTTGKLRLLNQQSSMGDHPCYVSVDRSGKWLAAGNYSSGTVSILPIKEDGSLGPATAVSTHSGHGANPARQASAHVHAAVFAPDNEFLFVPDLGMDQVVVYAFDEHTGMIRRTSSVQMQAGSGPRHLEFHQNGKWAYLIQELSGNISAFNYTPGKIQPFQTVSALPPGFKQSFTSADIHIAPGGRFLYASNRDSSNTIAIFRIDPLNGKLSLAGHQAVMGKTPRNFNFDPTGNFLLVANQNSDNIVIFRVDQRTGLLHDTGKRIMVSRPVCLKWE